MSYLASLLSSLRWGGMFVIAYRSMTSTRRHPAQFGFVSQKDTFFCNSGSPHKNIGSCELSYPEPSRRASAHSDLPRSARRPRSVVAARCEAEKHHISLQGGDTGVGSDLALRSVLSSAPVLPCSPFPTILSRSYHTRSSRNLYVSFGRFMKLLLGLLPPTAIPLQVRGWMRTRQKCA